MSETRTHKQRDIFTEGPIDPAFIAESIAKHATKTDIGAHEIFLGQVRADIVDGGGESGVVISSNSEAGLRSTRRVRAVEKRQPNVTAIEYTAYREMANEQMIAIREEAFARWPITCLHVHHSQGIIKAGELCFFVFASAPHRHAAREAVAFVTDEVKKRLPIFGKEVLEDCTHIWKNNL